MANSRQLNARIYSSLPLQILLFFNSQYYVVEWLVLLGCLIYKGTFLPFPPAALQLEIFGLFPFALLEACRLFIGVRGNKLEEKGTVGIFLGLSIIAFFGHLFYCWWQTYVLVLDAAFAGAGVLFVAGELAAGTAELIALPAAL
ncbi:hypothetical protein DFJ73DRAFT_587271 [Zopfochytrium polystomum]|nr:hypothetical protein DFJ73DRAFT_587271 [Zopfochytrium polystomum]